MKIRNIIIAIALLLLTGCNEPVTVKIVQVVPATPGFNGHSAYSVVENVTTHERQWISGVPGKEGETIAVSNHALQDF